MTNDQDGYYFDCLCVVCDTELLRAFEYCGQPAQPSYLSPWSSTSTMVSLLLLAVDSSAACVSDVPALASSVTMWRPSTVSRARYTARAARKCHVFGGLVSLLSSVKLETEKLFDYS